MNGKVDYLIVLRGFHQFIIRASQSDRETQISEFIYLMGTQLYGRNGSVMNYIQQQEIHDLSVTFRGISCVHQREIISFDPDCEKCVMS